MSFRLLIVCFFVHLSLWSQEDNVWLHPNHGQWDPRIDYSVEVSQGSMMIGSEGFIYFLNDAQSHKHSKRADHQDVVHAQVIRSDFQGVTWGGVKEEADESPFYRNYYYGKDPSRWKANVKSVLKTTYRDYYEGIDFQIEGSAAKLKYSFAVSPGADPSVIRSKISGASKLYLKDGSLHIVTRFGEIIEEKPVAWTLREGKRTDVPVKFRLQDSTLSYVFPKGYDKKAELIIDPSIVFSTFTGSTRDNWGMTATPDAAGNLYAGGIVFAGGNGTYPVTTGAFDMFFAGGTMYQYTFQGGTYTMQGFDVAITKFNKTGTSLVYSTFLGGTGNESVHSLVTDEQGELYVLGVTSSANFPVTPGCVKDTFSGGPNISTNELGFPQGADIYISHLSADGRNMLGSTFFGGTGTDGINSGDLFYNYGDPFRGEIIVKDGFVYVASSTSSTNITKVNSFQSTLQGPQDALVLKINPTMTTLSWSTYVGGGGYDSGNGIQISSTGMIYVAGGSTGTMPFNAGHTTSNQGGMADAYVMRMSNANGSVLSGTFIGTSEYDQAFFVQLDQDDEIYVYGQSEGTIPITAGKYGQPNSGQFVAKFNSGLLSRLWTTTIGSGSGHVEISPTAFLVSNCDEIYMAGWGGNVNQDNSPYATQSSTIGFPVTSDAYKSTTNGSNFWIGVLSAEAVSLKYATFMGGNSSSDHVDGGTSRFDKNGNIYHAVCAACGNSNFPTTPGVYSPQDPGPNCNLAAFKFELNTIEAIVGSPEPVICLPDPVIFNNNSANGNVFEWDFGDNTTSNEVNPSHTYAGPGIYTVTLIVSDSAQCFVPDTVTFTVNIGDFEGGIIDPPPSICPNVPVQMEAYGGISYKWSPAEVFNDPNIYNPIATVSETMVVSCIVSDSCGTDTVSVTLNVLENAMTISNDTTICIGNSVPLFASGVTTVTWSPSTYLDDPSSSTPTSTPDQSITYHVSGTTTQGCPASDSVRITVEFNPPTPNMPDTVHYCFGSTKVVTVSGATSYTWSPAIDISPATGNVVTLSAQSDRYYYCDFTNACATIRDSLFADIIAPVVLAGNDTIVCPGEVFYMWASGASSYAWTPSVTSLVPDGSSVAGNVPQSTVFTVTGTDQYGCRDNASVSITTFPRPSVDANPNVYAFLGDEVQLSATASSSGAFSWSPTEYLTCVNCPDPIATPDQNFEYVVSFTDENGCTATDRVKIIYDPIIYVPNAFTPDGNELNSFFYAVGGNIKTFHMDLFNRWGELIFTSDAMRDGWDGTYQGLECQDGVYTWKIRYTDFNDKEFELVGHVTLLR